MNFQSGDALAGVGAVLFAEVVDIDALLEFATALPPDLKPARGSDNTTLKVLFHGFYSLCQKESVPCLV